MGYWIIKATRFGEIIYSETIRSRKSAIDNLEEFLDNLIYEDKPCFDLMRESLIETNSANLNEQDIQVRLTYVEE